MQHITKNEFETRWVHQVQRIYRQVRLKTRRILHLIPQILHEKTVQARPIEDVDVCRFDDYGEPDHEELADLDKK